MTFIVPLSFYLLYLHYYAVGLILIAIVQGASAMIIPFIIPSLFPTNIRLSGIAFAYNISSTIFGGLSPILLTALINQKFNVYLVPVFYLEFVVLIISPLSLMIMKTNKSSSEHI